jgi:UDP-N-acetylglucosamine 2-epimerase (non-hydrolysing)
VKLLLVAGARPNFMKVAPVARALAAARAAGAADLAWKLVHTGQHYDHGMSRVFFDELGIPEPDFDLACGSGSHAEQTARVMVAFEKVCLAEAPDAVVVVGDVNSTPACAITAKKLGIRVAHVEAGLRSGDMGMPEEVNRIVTDSIADWLFVTEKSGVANLRREGHPDERIHFVGNVMIDTLLHQVGKLGRAKAAAAPARPYAVVTLHRPGNVDDPATLRGILEALAVIAKDYPVVFPVHPRTRARIAEFGLGGLAADAAITFTEPLPYVEFLRLWSRAMLVLTDSGGLQEETTALGIPCFTLRENTERPITIEEGTNVLVGPRRERILAAYREFREGRAATGGVPALWDGEAAGRIVQILLRGA